MPATEFNARLGSKGRRMFYDTVTLASGTATTVVPCENVNCVILTQADAVAAAEGLSSQLSASNGSTTITVDSSNGSSTVTVDVLAVGY